MVGKYGKKGFVVVGVTTEAKGPTEKYVTDTGADMIVALCKPGKDGMQELGLRGYPSAVLVAPNGKIVWSAHPSGLTEAIIEEHIGDVRMSAPDKLALDLELPKKHAGIAKKLRQGKFGSAWKDLDRALQRAKGDDQAVLESALGEVKASLEELQTAITTATQEGRFADVEFTLDLIAKHFQGRDESRDARAAIRELKADLEKRSELEAGRLIRKGQAALAEGKRKSAIRSLEMATKGRYAETREAARAKKIIAEINKGG